MPRILRYESRPGVAGLAPHGVPASRARALATLLALAVLVAITSGEGASARAAQSTNVQATTQPVWNATDPLNVARDSQTATLLRGAACEGADATAKCGAVLVAGGDDADGDVLSSAEVYAPVAQQWQLTGSMTMARADASATMLPNGTVLVAGGYTNRSNGGTPRSVTSAAEIYDPATGIWTRTSSMLVARAGQTATLLGSASCTSPRCEDVLMIGGDQRDSGWSSSAELYDPARHTWSAAADLPGPVSVTHTATLLDDAKCALPNAPAYCGDVLVVSEGSSWLFDPRADGWRSASPMQSSHDGSTATALLDGRVLLAGGLRGGAHTGAMPTSGRPALDEVYDPSTNAWTLTTSMNHPRTRHTATLIAGAPCRAAAASAYCGDVLVTGGRDDGFDSAEIFDPGTARWTIAPSLLVGGAEQSASMLADGAVLVVGGVSITSAGSSGPGEPRGATDAAEVLDLAGGRPAPYVETVYPSSGHAGTQVLISGARLDATRAVTFAGVPARFAINSPSLIAATAPDGPIGSAAIRVQSSEATSIDTRPATFSFGDSTGPWQDAGISSEIVSGQAAAQLDGPACRAASPPKYCGEVLIAGGEDGTGQPVSAAELYDPSSKSWSTIASMHDARDRPSAVLLNGGACRTSPAPPYCGRVLVLGGLGVGDQVLATAELYDPATRTWTNASPMSVPRAAQTATLLTSGACIASSRPSYCGDVLVAGGSGQFDLEQPAASAELYVPTSNSWVPTGDLLTGRAAHSAVALTNGSVLVTGGLGAGGDNGQMVADTVLASAEIYDPTAGRWTSAGTMTASRFYQSAALIDTSPCASRCGRVLVIGGTTSLATGALEDLSSSELFDPDSRTWTSGPSLHTPRSWSAATTIAGGQVLVTGGGGMTVDADPHLVSSMASVEAYSAKTNQWSRLIEGPVRRGVHTATLLDGSQCAPAEAATYCGDVLLVGGATSSDTNAPLMRRVASLYSPATEPTRLPIGVIAIAVLASTVLVVVMTVAGMVLARRRRLARALTASSRRAAVGVLVEPSAAEPHPYGPARRRASEDLPYAVGLRANGEFDPLDQHDADGS